MVCSVSVGRVASVAVTATNGCPPPLSPRGIAGTAAGRREFPTVAVVVGQTVAIAAAEVIAGTAAVGVIVLVVF